MAAESGKRSPATGDEARRDGLVARPGSPGRGAGGRYGRPGTSGAALREVPRRARADEAVGADEEEVPVPAGELGDEALLAGGASRGAARPRGRRAGPRSPASRAPSRVAAQELLEPGGRLAARRPRPRGVQPRHVGLGGEEEAHGPGPSEELEGERALAVHADGVHARAREGRELAHDGGDLDGGERHGRARKGSGRPEAAAALLKT